MFENLSIRVRVKVRLLHETGLGLAPRDRLQFASRQVKVRLLHETGLGLAPRDRLQFALRDWLRACSARD
jgi:hypothetical protein